MNVFLYTSCPTGKRADDPRLGGFGVRAWTAGSTRPALEPVIRLCGAEFPAKHPDTKHPDTKHPDTKRLLFARRDSVLVLLRTVPGAADEVGRGGVPFTHAVADLPPDFDPLEAIRTWESPDWIAAYPADADTTLPGAPAVPGPGPLTDADLKAFLADAKNRELARYLLAAAVAPNPPQKAYLYAPSDVVARAVYAVLLAAPRQLRHDLTFSTYEKNLLDSPARIVATWGDTRENDLPRTCYQPTGAAINWNSGRVAAKFDAVYADLALDWLAAGAPDKIGQFHTRAAELKVTSGVALGDLAALLFAPERLDPDAVERLLASSATAAELVKTPAAVARVREWAVDGAPKGAELLIAVVRAAPALRTETCASLEKVALEAARAGQPERMVRALDLLKRIDAEREARFGTVAESELNAKALAWPVRAELLPRVAAAFRTGKPRDLDDWLHAEQVQLADLLALIPKGVPEAWAVRAVALVAAREPITSAKANEWLVADPKRLADVARQLPDGTDPGARLAEALKRADLKRTFDAFEEGGGTAPAVVVDRALADHKGVRQFLARRSLVQRLTSAPPTLARVAREAVEDQAAEIHGRAFADAVGAPLADCVAGAAWQMLRDNKVPAARWAFEKALPALGQKDPLAERIETEPFARYEHDAQQYLLDYALAHGDDAQVLAWREDLKRPLFARALAHAPSLPTTKAALVGAYTRRFHEVPPELNDKRLPVTVVCEALSVLLGEKKEREVRAVLTAQGGSGGHGDTLRKHLLQDAGRAALANLALDILVKAAPDTAAAYGQPVAAAHGVTPAVRELVRLVLDRDTGPTRDECDFLRSAATAQASAGPLDNETRSNITVELVRSTKTAKGTDMWDWLLRVLQLLGSGKTRERQRADAAEHLGRVLLDPKNWNSFEQLVDEVVKAKGKAFTSAAEVVYEVLGWVHDQQRAKELTNNIPAVVWCFELALGIRGGGKYSANEPTNKAVAWLCYHLYAGKKEYAFFDVFRYTGQWPPAHVKLLETGYTAAAKKHADEANAPGGTEEKKRSLWRRLWD